MQSLANLVQIITEHPIQKRMLLAIFLITTIFFNPLNLCQCATIRSPSTDNLIELYDVEQINLITTNSPIKNDQLLKKDISRSEADIKEISQAHQKFIDQLDTNLVNSGPININNIAKSQHQARMELETARKLCLDKNIEKGDITKCQTEADLVKFMQELTEQNKPLRRSIRRSPRRNVGNRNRILLRRLRMSRKFKNYV